MIIKANNYKGGKFCCFWFSTSCIIGILIILVNFQKKIIKLIIIMMIIMIKLNIELRKI